MDFTSPNVQFKYDLKNNPFFVKDSQNLINLLSVKELNTLGKVSLLDIFLSKSNVVEPHTHQNASELVYCISGSALVSIINPFTKQLLNIPIKPGQVANVPQGWWHYEIARVDNIYLLAIFDAPIPQFIGGSDVLRLTPPEVLAHTYGLQESLVREALAPITHTTFIGPPHIEEMRNRISHKTKHTPIHRMTANRGVLMVGMRQVDDLWVDKLLNPVGSIGTPMRFTNANFCIVGVEDIGSVTSAVHPILHDCCSIWLTCGNIFSRVRVVDAKGRHHVEWASVFG